MHKQMDTSNYSNRFVTRVLQGIFTSIHLSALAYPLLCQQDQKMASLDASLSNPAKRAVIIEHNYR